MNMSQDSNDWNRDNKRRKLSCEDYNAMYEMMMQSDSNSQDSSCGDQCNLESVEILSPAIESSGELDELNWWNDSPIFDSSSPPSQPPITRPLCGRYKHQNGDQDCDDFDMWESSANTSPNTSLSVSSSIFLSPIHRTSHVYKVKEIGLSHGMTRLERLNKRITSLQQLISQSQGQIQILEQEIALLSELERK